MRHRLNKCLAPIWAPLLPLLAPLLLTACDQAPHGALSQWAVAQWTMEQSLSAQGPPIERLSAYLSERALKA